MNSTLHYHFRFYSSLVDVKLQADLLVVFPAFRYVYIKATGVEDRWRSIFSVVLCEIMVY